MGLSYVSWLFFLYVTALFLSPTTTFGGTNQTDRLALLAFKSKITHDPLGIMNLWNDSLHFCEWHGVTCGRRHQRVTSLDLPSMSLAGSISPYIGNLSFLRNINLVENNFSGEIPQQMSHLFRLEVLYLNNNSLGGGIPANLHNCSNLKFIFLSHNMLVGKIPVELGSLLKLTNLNLNFNSLMGGIPHSFGNLSSLEKISLESNGLDGGIPDSLSRLTSLTFLLLTENKLSGKIPSSIYNISSISLFALALNQLCGSLPLDLGLTLPNLQVFNIYDNRFISGPIPISISNASKLVEFDISNNNFTGKVSINWGSMQDLYFLALSSNYLGSGEADDLSFLNSLINCSNLENLGLESNHFGGMLPDSIANFSSQIKSVYLGGNQIFGIVPLGIGNLVNLDTLTMEFNLLTGSIPTTIGKLQKLQLLSFGINSFSGQIPSSMGNLTQVLQLELNGNYFNGSIPPSLGNCTSLLLLNLSQNNFSGKIPQQVLGLSSLSIELDLSHNNLIGSLPSEVVSLNNLQRLDISNNKLSGEIPNDLGSCRSLLYLSLRGNFFQGSIPSSLTTLSAIDHLDLSRNKLSGRIPKYLCNFTFLNYLNLSFNDLEGEVPVEGVFKNVTAISIVGNKRLCGGIPELQLSVCPTTKPKKRRLSLAIKLVIAASSVVLCFGFALVLILYQRKKGRSGHPSTASTRNQLLKISYQELQKATDGFSPANFVGAGSFGSVFKGILDQDEIVVAVKVLNLQHRGASKSFMAECEALKNIRHRNLVKVITSCSAIDFHGNDFKALVYEFMPNGSLERWLHPVEDTHIEMRNLKFLQRLNIAIDIADAMDYLHNHCQTPIIHCDLKPSNVLLDNDMTAHVSDFGLARFLVETTNKSSQNQTSSMGIKGSIGYTAPEYGMGSEVSTQGDVYSYGILLLETFTGKRPTNDMFKDSFNLHNYAKMALPEQVMEIIDPTIVFFQEAKEEATTSKIESWRNLRGDKIRTCLISVIKIGVACSMESPRERMNMSDVARELHLIKDSFLKVGIHDDGGRR